MSEQRSHTSTSSQRPTTNGSNDWRAYWRESGQPWRTEPEIDERRKEFLFARRNIKPDIEKGIYPFKGASLKLTRADVEWLLATHEDGLGFLGPVAWNEEQEKAREGLDLRGAILNDLTLAGLPLTRVRLGLDARSRTDNNCRREAAASLEHTVLRAAHLEGCIGIQANLARADLVDAHLEGAMLGWSDLTSADLQGVHLEGAFLGESVLEDARLDFSHLEGAVLDGSRLCGASLIGADLAGAEFTGSHLEGAVLLQCNLAGKIMDDDDLSRIRRWKPYFENPLQGACLACGFFDMNSALDDSVLDDEMYGGVTVVDVNWGGVNLGHTDWSHVRVLGDEREANKQRSWNPDSREWKVKSRAYRIIQYNEASRAYRQLAVALREQGITEHADRFAYRAQVLQREILFLEIGLPTWGLWHKLGQTMSSHFAKFSTQWKRVHQFGQYLFSLFLGLIAGYGYKPGRTVLWYLSVILGFAVLYHSYGHLPLPEAVILSITSFHGRGFFPGNSSLSDPKVVLAAFEAVIGLIIEVSFIATFTQRFFGK